ncbi:MAG: sugar ABC transporter ATP-binding protein [Flammeovirgaceae bacterium]|nr:sugar ABC transporter ATP-binding protein [Flammeovirgaceae bacterium]
MEKYENDIKLKLTNITKIFPGVVALDDVSLELKTGEVHALCGENGAGKSTLMNVLSGNHQPDEGAVILRGDKVDVPNQLVAQKLGIGIVYQERSLVNDLSVAENIYAGNQPTNRWGIINFKKLFAQAKVLLAKLGMADIDPKTKLEYLSPGKQQMVEIAKALSQNPEILILDEPTASISETDAKVLFQIIHSLTQEGVAVIYISHRMSEIFQIADRVSILKDGKYQGTRIMSEISVDDIIRLMVGRDLVKQDYQSHVGEEVILKAENFNGPDFLNISFELKKGEVLGLAGLVGAGRTELARAIFGVDKKYEGELTLNQNPVKINHPMDAMKLGIGYLPEHRKEQGLFLEMTVEENIVATNLDVAVENKLLQFSKISDVANSYIQKLGIKTPDSKQKVVNLSGGNQQKIVLAKWLLLNPKVLIVDEPTHGVDVGAKAEIYAILKELTEKGTSIIMISSELPELLSLSDRILVLCNGNLTAELPKEDFSEEKIMHFASGTKNMFNKNSEKIGQPVSAN